MQKTCKCVCGYNWIMLGPNTFKIRKTVSGNKDIVRPLLVGIMPQFFAHQPRECCKKGKEASIHRIKNGEYRDGI